MPVLALNQPVTQRDPLLQVENRLGPGRYRFRLVVIDTAGLESASADLILTVEAPPPPPSPPRGPFRPINPDLLERVIRGGIRIPRRPNG